MILNELLTKQSVLKALLLKNENEELNKDLKVKIVRLKIEYGKVIQQFEIDSQNFIKTLIPEELTKLQEKPEDLRTEEENKKIQELVDTANSAYNIFVNEKLNGTVSINKDDTFTEKEFEEIIVVNLDTTATINNAQLGPDEFLALFNALFVK